MKEVERMSIDYETVCFRMGYVEWSNLKERIDDPEVQACIQTFMDAFDAYVTVWENYKASQTVENEERCYHAEWCGHVAAYNLLIHVDDGKVLHKPFDDPYEEWLRKIKYQQKINDIVPLEKELPDDVLSIIRQYSKPAFVHFREYNEALRIFTLPLFYKKKLKEKIGDADVRKQIQICVEANEDYDKNNKVYLADKTHDHEYLRDKSNWWASVSRDKFVSLLDGKEYRMQGYAEWYFQDEIDNAWRDSDDDPPTDHESEDPPTDHEWEVYLQTLDPQVFEQEEETKNESNDPSV
jgi:hypothetical protein